MSKVVMRNSDGSMRGGRECPKCRFSMEYLRDSALLDREFGYELDNGTGWSPNDSPLFAFLIGSPSRYLWRNVIGPLISKFIGDRANNKYQRILKAFPNALVCTHCEYIIKQP